MKKLISSIAILGVIAGFGIGSNHIVNNAGEVDPPVSFSPKVAIWLPEVPPAVVKVG